MLRMVIQYLLPLLLPIIIYITYVGVTRWGEPDWMKDGPWLTLLGIGVVLMVISLVTFALLGGAEPTGTYVAPRFEDGRVVPGGFAD